MVWPLLFKRESCNLYSPHGIIKTAANDQKRNLSNFIEFAALQYLAAEQYVDNSEINEIIQDVELLKNLRKGRKELKRGDYTLV